jgi:hypothetical protein
MQVLDRGSRALCRALLAGLLLSSPAARPSYGGDSRRVTLVQAPGGAARLTRDGAAFFVKGVGLDKGSIGAAADLGANSLRTWGAENLDQVLNEAHRNGMTVAAGIWLGHERHGFRYDDPAQVSRQKEEVRKVVERFKDHPALLVWGLGNEMEGDGHNDDIWRAVEEIAVMVKQLDPNHPTMTVISEFGDDPAKILGTHNICKHIDIVGLNSYAPVTTLAIRYRKLGGTKPYLVTEFGPRGWWEASRTAWGAAIEPSSTEKAGMYQAGYEASVLGQPLCLGSYAFLWGWKQEATATWFGLVLPGGDRLEAVDVLSRFWRGRDVANRCPVVEPLRIEGPVELAPGSAVTVHLRASDPDSDPLRVSWELSREGTPKGGGDAEPVPKSIPEAIAESDSSRCIVRLPAEAGGYRVFATIRDGRGGAATVNLPVLVSQPK